MGGAPLRPAVAELTDSDFVSSCVLLGGLAGRGLALAAGVESLLAESPVVTAADEDANR